MVESLHFQALQDAYASGRLTPSAVAATVLSRIEAAGDDHVWIERVAPDAFMARAHELDALAPETRAALPLYGLPFAVKDNFDVAGMPTTAGCPAYAYRPARNATAVERLLAAGAMLVGKTNLDQFATGLVGVRSPYGVPRNPFDAAFIPGGSSSGSAVAVAAGLVSFALGTDTAGSGRVPAAFNNIVGVKPTRGLVSTSGLVPACRSLDCPSVFALTVEDGMQVLEVIAGSDADDAFSRPAPDMPPAFETGLRFGVPADAYLDFFGNGEAERLYRFAVERLVQLGGERVEIDFAPFAETARLLYEGPWVAERAAAIGDFIAAHGDTVLPVTRRIIEGGTAPSAVDAFRASYRLEALRHQAARMFDHVSILLLPTTGTIYTIEQVLADPIAKNSDMGRYVNFTNLLDLSAIAVPAGFQSNGLPAGVTLMAPAFREAALAPIAAALHRATPVPLGATKVPQPEIRPISYGTSKLCEIFVIGAHLSGQKLNGQLAELGARHVETCATAPTYRLFRLPGIPARPGMVCVPANGAAIEGELWQLTEHGFGRFLDRVQPPLAIGTIELADGRHVKGFLCEDIATQGMPEITAYGGWRAWLQQHETG